MPATDVFTPGSTALITGGASGIGLAIAKICRKKGMRICLVDRDVVSLRKAKQEMTSKDDDGKDIVTYTIDVSLPESWETLKSDVKKDMGSIEVLVLNAGMAPEGGWDDYDYFKDTFETNVFGVINGIHAFLPIIQKAAESKRTAIIITGSKQGITNRPGNPAYNASKAAVKSLAEHLSWDLRDKSTSVHLLVPGWTFTGITGSKGRKDKPPGAWNPEQVADYLYRKMGEGKFYVVCPDNEVSAETDKWRIRWSADEIINERPPLTRWREEWKEAVDEAMAAPRE